MAKTECMAQFMKGGSLHPKRRRLIGTVSGELTLCAGRNVSPDDHIKASLHAAICLAAPLHATGVRDKVKHDVCLPRSVRVGHVG